MRSESACEPSYRNFSSLGGNAYYHKDATGYYAFRRAAHKPVHGTMELTQRLRAGVCQAAMHDATWTTMIIGPFVTQGGYDWTSAYLPNVFFDVIREKEDSRAKAEAMEEEFEDDDDEDVRKVAAQPRHFYGVQAFFAAPIDIDGRVLSWPPLHVHHFEAMPLGTTGVMVTTGDSLCTLTGTEGSDETECYGMDLGGGVAVHAPPLPMDLDMNDVRPAGSPPLTWSLHAATKVVNVHDFERRRWPLVDLHTLILKATASSGIPFAPLFAPTDADSFMFATGRMPYAGRLLKTRLHAHLFQDVTLHAGSPAELGFASAGLTVEHDCFSRRVATSGFQTGAALRSHMLSVSPLVCFVEGSHVLIDGGRYVRAGVARCDEWRFASRDPFTLTTLIYANPAYVPIEAPPGFMDGYRQIHLFLDIFYSPEDHAPHMSSGRYSGLDDSPSAKTEMADTCLQLAEDAAIRLAPESQTVLVYRAAGLLLLALGAGLGCSLHGSKPASTVRRLAAASIQYVRVGGAPAQVDYL